MTSDIYPTAPVEQEIIKLDKNEVAADCITQMSAGLTKAQAIGIVLNGSDDVATFNEVWDDIVSEGKAMRQVSLKKEDESFKTESEYKSDLNDCHKYLSSTLWYSGLKTEKQVSSYDELKTVMYPEE